MVKSGRFPLVPTAEMTTMERSFGGASGASIVIDTMVEKKKHLYEQLLCFGQPQSPSTAMTETEAFPIIPTPQAPNEEEEWIVLNGFHWMDCT